MKRFINLYNHKTLNAVKDKLATVCLFDKKFLLKGVYKATFFCNIYVKEYMVTFLKIRSNPYQYRINFTMGLKQLYLKLSTKVRFILEIMILLVMKIRILNSTTSRVEKF